VFEATGDTLCLDERGGGRERDRLRGRERERSGRNGRFTVYMCRVRMIRTTVGERERERERRDEGISRGSE
jgi:hypothetical protein